MTEVISQSLEKVGKEWLRTAENLLDDVDVIRHGS